MSLSLPSETRPIKAHAAVWRARAARVLGAVSLVVLCAVVMVPGLTSIGPIDRDESRFAQASRQMFESVALPDAAKDPAMHSGGLAVPMVGDRPRVNKPPLVYWLQTASAAVFARGDPLADAIWMYRVPSVVCAALAVLLTWRIGRSMTDARVAWLAAAMLAVCPVVVFDAHQARADQLLLACTTLAMLGLWLVYRHPAQRWLGPGALWLGIALGLLAKGPITPMVVALTALALCLVGREWRWLKRTRPMLGLIGVALLVTPWVIAVGEQLGWHEMAQLAYDETLGRASSPKEGHWGPPGYHLVLLPALFWPGSLLTAFGLGVAARRAVSLPSLGSRRARWRARVPRDRAMLFLLCWIVPSWIVFEASSTKLPHYTLPLYPAIALVSARAVLAGPVVWRRLKRLDRVGFGVWGAIGVLLLCGPIVAAGVLLLPTDAGRAGVLFAAGLGAAAVTLRSTASAIRCHVVRAQLAALAVPVIVAPAIFGLLLPGAIGRPSVDAMRAVHAVDPAAERALAAVGYHEDSLTFLSRARAERIGAEQVDAWLSEHEGGLVLLPKSLLAEFPRLESVAFATGFNVGTGRFVDLVLCQRAGAKRGGDAP